MDHGAEMLAALLVKSMNLGPEWTVVGSEFREVDGGKDELHVYLSRTPGHAVPCPVCGRPSGVYDTRPREWRHLDVWQFKTIVHLDLPRVDCPECGVHAAKVPWEGGSAHFTALFEAQALAMLMAGMTVSGAARVLDEHDTRLWRMVVGAVAEARALADFSGVSCVGVDETSRRRGHNYLTCFVDAERRRVLFATEGKDASTVAAFAEDLAAHGGDPAKVSVVTCDMSPAFEAGVRESLPNAERVVDRFHVMQPFSKAIDEVRVAESRESGEKRALLSRTRYVWLKNEGSLTERQRAKKESLSRRRLKTGRACAMRESMQDVYASRTRPEAKGRLDALTSWMMHSRLEPMKKVARMLREHETEILNYFDHRCTNAILEGLNSMVQSAKRAARGYRNTEYFKAIIYLRLGKLPFPVLEKCATH